MRSNLKVFFMYLAIATLGSSLLANYSYAVGESSGETTKEKMDEAGRDVKRGTKKVVRKVKDETCEMVNGKMKCVAQKVKHSAQNVGDKVEDAVE